MSKHTKGPWRMHDMEKNTIVGNDHLAIADTNATSRSSEENKANAKLIAAAPELLECLKELKETPKMAIWIGTKYSEGILLEKCEQAINKAGG